jgi:hypothetical protein
MFTRNNSYDTLPRARLHSSTTEVSKSGNFLLCFASKVPVHLFTNCLLQLQLCKLLLLLRKLTLLTQVLPTPAPRPQAKLTKNFVGAAHSAAASAVTAHSSSMHSADTRVSVLHHREEQPTVTGLMKSAIEMPEYGTKAAIQEHAEAAAEKAVALLTQLPSIGSVGGQQQLADTMQPLLPAQGAGAAILSGLRVAVASKLGVRLAEACSQSAHAQEAAAAALSVLVQSAPAEERIKMASSAHVVQGLASYLEHFNMHGCGYTTVSASSWGVGAAAAGTGVLQLAGNSKLPLAALTAPASLQPNSPALHEELACSQQRGTAAGSCIWMGQPVSCAASSCSTACKARGGAAAAAGGRAAATIEAAKQAAADAEEQNRARGPTAMAKQQC